MTNPKVTKIAVNGSGGAAVIVRCTIMASYAEIQEDPSLNAGVAQGLVGQRLDPFTGVGTVTETWEPNTQGQEGEAFQPITFGDPRRIHGAFGDYIGQGGSGGAPETPGKPPSLGTPLVSLKSLTATATGILLKEWS
jgi:hypothetical protein